MKRLDLLSVGFASVIAIVTIVIIMFTGEKSGHGASVSWTEDEMGLVASADSLMRVLTVTDSTDLIILRGKAVGLNAPDLLSDTYSRLASLMLATVTSPGQGGVGIAAPQVGLSRRVVAVQRFDKEGEPFEVYPNIRIEEMYGETEPGMEGCLSIPGKRGMVKRFRNIVISYSDVEALKGDSPELSACEVRDTVSGFTAVIFQHEVDHLDGILYTDRAEDISDFAR